MPRWYEIAGGVLLAVTLAMGSAACDASGPQRKYAEQAFREDPEDYTHTTQRGVIDSAHVDQDDWRIGPDYQFGGSAQPAFPNPTRKSEVALIVQMGIDNQEGANLTLCTHDPDRDGLLLLRSKRARNGPSFTFIVSPAQFSRTGLKRFFVLDTNGSNCGGRLVTYGDVLFE